MTPEQIAELEALAAKATPGHWEVEEDPTQDGDHATLVCLSGKFGIMGTWLLGCFHNWKEAAKGERRISWKKAESNATLIVALVNNLPAILAALKAQPPASGSDWFAGDVDCDGNELVTLRADELQKLRDDREKFMWQVRDTCARAEMAEAALKAQQPDDAMVERVARRKFPILGSRGASIDWQLVENPDA